MIATTPHVATEHPMPLSERQEMRPARGPRRSSDPRASRLLVAHASGLVEESTMGALPSLLRPGDLLVVNDAATRPSSLLLETVRGEPIEARLLDESGGTFGAILFGAGDWHDDTDRRPPPPALAIGTPLFDRVTKRACATVLQVSERSARWVRLAVDEHAVFAAARPVQYSYMDADLALADVQTPYASRPWAAEMPSAGRALTVSLLVALRRRGVRIARLTAAAGLSATGDPALDRSLPLPERFHVPAETLRAVDETRARGGRAVAVGTSTVRALESATGPGEGIATLIVGPGFVPSRVDGILSGMHEEKTSHDAVLRAFAADEVVDRVIAQGRERGFLVHELGDHCLILSR